MEMSGMDDNSTSSSSMSMMMLSYLHFRQAGYIGDYVLFKAWRPSTAGALAGAAIGLLFFAILERFLAGVRGRLCAKWQEAEHRRETTCHDTSSLDGKDSEKAVSLPPPTSTRFFPPFYLSRDIPRGILYSIHSLFGYVLMLNVMTFQAAYIITIIVGLGIGEMLFGRMGTMGAH